MGLSRHLSTLGEPGELYMLQYNFQPDLSVNNRQCGYAAAEVVGDLDGDLDRLAGLSGVATRIVEMTNDMYLAGPWYGQLPFGLSWSILAPCTGFDGYRAPP